MQSEKIINWLEKNVEIKTVVLSFAGGDYLDAEFNAAQKENKWLGSASEKVGNSRNQIDTFSDGLELAIRKLENSGKIVVFLLPPPTQAFPPRDCFRNATLQCELSKSNVLASQLKIRTILASIVRVHKNVRVFDPLDIFCDKSSCYYARGKTIYFYDTQHLSIAGSEYYASHFLAWLYSH